MKKVSSAMNIRVEEKFTSGPESKYFYRPTSAINSNNLFKNRFNKTKRLSTQLFSSKSTINSSSSSILMRMSSSSKLILYDEALQLKHQRNDLMKEIALLKSNIRKKEVEILSKEKIIEKTKVNNIPDQFNYEKIIDENSISKIKKAFNELKSLYQSQIESNEKLKSIIRQSRPSESVVKNNFLERDLAELVSHYSVLQDENEILEKEHNDYVDMSQNCAEKHQVIQSLQATLDVHQETVKQLKRDIQLLNDNNNQLTNKIKKIRLEREKKLKYQNKLFEDKKNEEAFVKMKPVYESKMKELEIQINKYKEMYENNNKIIKDLQNINGRLNQRKETEKTLTIKTINYKQFEIFETNPHLDYDSKILLMNSMINESKQKQLRYKTQIEIMINELTEFNKPVQSIEEINKEINNMSQSKTVKFSSQQNQNEQDQDKIQTNQPNQLPKVEIEEIKEVNDEQIEDIKLSGEEFTEITYVIMKNIEARRLNPLETQNKIFQNITIEQGKNNEEIIKTKPFYIDQISNNISSLLELLLEKDKKKVREWVEALLALNNNKINKVFENFDMLLINNIRQYNDDEDLIYSKKIKHLLLPIKDKLKAKFAFANTENNEKNNGHISFIVLKQFLEEEKIEMKDLYGEYLFFKLKQSKAGTQHLALYDLDIKVLFDIFDNDLNDSKMNEKTETDIEISQEEYTRIITELVINVNEYLLKNKKSLREVLINSIKTIESEEKNQGFDVINIEDFLDELKKIKIEIVNELEIYCLFNRYKVSDDFEFLSVDLIINDLNGLKSLTKQDLLKSKPMENVPEEEESNDRAN